jgi:hypothetical protein
MVGASGGYARSLLVIAVHQTGASDVRASFIPVFIGFLRFGGLPAVHEKVDENRSQPRLAHNGTMLLRIAAVVTSGSDLSETVTNLQQCFSFYRGVDRCQQAGEGDRTGKLL